MKIGIVGTVWINTPPKHYGGTEEVMYNLVNSLVDRGHDVTFFGPKTADVKAKIVPTVPVPLREINISWSNFTYTLSHISDVFDHAEAFDIVHVHLNKSQDLVSLPFSVYKNIPTVFTLHSPSPDPVVRPDKYALLAKYRALPYVSISDTQRKDVLNYIATVHNGIDLTQYPFVENPKDYFVWLGKIMPAKGTKEAILAAKSAGVKLVLMGVIEQGIPQNLHYYRHDIAPLIDNKQIVFYEKVGLPEKAILLGNAKAMLNPINWEEPFGLVMIEAQATGTPVIAFDKGAAPEVIQHNKTGFVVKSFDELVMHMSNINTLKRVDCREFVETHFSVATMVDGYEHVYKEAITNWSTYYNNQQALLTTI